MDDIKKHIEVIDQMMEYLNTHTVNGIPIRPTLEAAKKAMQKQEPKSVKVKDGLNECPCCGARGVVPWSDGHCVACGQALTLEGGNERCL